MTDREAILAIRRDERVDHHFSILYERHFERVLKDLNRWTGSYEDALELAQETFVRLYTHAATLDPERDLAPWLTTVSRNLHRSWQRRQLSQRRDARLTVALGKPRAAGSALADRKGWSADSSVVLDEFQAFVADLPEAVRIIFHMKYISGQSYRKIQELTGLSHEQIKHRLETARKLYRETFGEGLLGGRWKR